MCWKEKIIASLISTHIYKEYMSDIVLPPFEASARTFLTFSSNLLGQVNLQLLNCIEIKTLQQDNSPLRCTLKTENIKVIHFLNFLTFSPFRDGIERYRFFCWVFSIFLDFFLDFFSFFSFTRVFCDGRRRNWVVGYHIVYCCIIWNLFTEVSLVIKKRGWLCWR